MQGSEFSGVQLTYVGSVEQNVTSNSSRRLLQTSDSAAKVRRRQFRLGVRFYRHPALGFLVWSAHRRREVTGAYVVDALAFVMSQ
jgi:hypothetical protein